MKYQLEEHLVCKAGRGEGEIFFSDRHHDELIGRISSAYNIEVSFLDLDKMSKKI